METVAKRIHTEFLESFENSEKNLIQKINELEKTNRDTSNFQTFEELSSLGFSNSQTIVKATNVTSDKRKMTYDLQNLQKLQIQINEVKMKYPYKIISYGQIINILEKYNLYISRSENYIDIMPEENAKQIVNYSNIFKNMFNGARAKDNLILGNIADSHKPICAQYIYELNRQLFNYFVCAPHEMFKKANDRFIVGREIFYNPNMLIKYKHVPTTVVLDPIVLHPIWIDNPIAKMLKLFHVVTAWGPEAKEPAIFNQQMN